MSKPKPKYEKSYTALAITILVVFIACNALIGCVKSANAAPIHTYPHEAQYWEISTPMESSTRWHDTVYIPAMPGVVYGFNGPFRNAPEDNGNSAHVATLPIPDYPTIPDGSVSRWEYVVTAYVTAGIDPESTDNIDTSQISISTDRATYRAIEVARTTEAVPIVIYKGAEPATIAYVSQYDVIAEDGTSGNTFALSLITSMEEVPEVPVTPVTPEVPAAPDEYQWESNYYGGGSFSLFGIMGMALLAMLYLLYKVVYTYPTKSERRRIHLHALSLWAIAILCGVIIVATLPTAEQQLESNGGGGSLGGLAIVNMALLGLLYLLYKVLNTHPRKKERRRIGLQALALWTVLILVGSFTICSLSEAEAGELDIDPVVYVGIGATQLSPRLHNLTSGNVDPEDTVVPSAKVEVGLRFNNRVTATIGYIHVEDAADRPDLVGVDYNNMVSIGAKVHLGKVAVGVSRGIMEATSTEDDVVQVNGSDMTRYSASVGDTLRLDLDRSSRDVNSAHIGWVFTWDDAEPVVVPAAPVEPETEVLVPTPREIAIEEIRAVVLETAFFNYDSSELAEGGWAAVKRIAELMTEHDIGGQLIGSASSPGTNAYNMSLSLRRAVTVMYALRSLNVDTYLTTSGEGEENPQYMPPSNPKNQHVRINPID